MRRGAHPRPRAALAHRLLGDRGWRRWVEKATVRGPRLHSSGLGQEQAVRSRNGGRGGTGLEEKRKSGRGDGEEIRGPE